MNLQKMEKWIFGTYRKIIEDLELILSLYTLCYLMNKTKAYFDCTNNSAKMKKKKNEGPNLCHNGEIQCQSLQHT